MSAAVCKVIPTGITSLDGLIGGGFPSGSLVLLVGEIGSGHEEFIVTSLAMVAAMKTGRITRPMGGGIVLPKEIWWVTFTRTSADMLREAEIFDVDIHESLRGNVNFKDFSESYFATSSVPLEWVSEKRVEEGKEEKLSMLGEVLAGIHRAAERPAVKPKGLLDSLADFLSEHAQGSLIVLHSLTDLARLYSDSEPRWHEFVMFLRGLRRAAKKWDGLIYTDLITDLLDKRKEEEIAACADGVLVFSWEQAGQFQRRRTLFIREFHSLLSCYPRAATKFEVNIGRSTGLYVVRPEVIEGLRRSR
jgi:KaiC/GvpD/RAD55 family RecA-like ATPase